MKKAFKFQFTNMLNTPSFILAFVFAMFLSVLCFIINCIPWIGNDVINIPPAYMQFVGNGINLIMVRIFSIILPFLATVAFSDSFLTDYNNNSLSVLLLRFGKKNYYYSKLLCVFCGGLLIIAIPQIINMLLCLIAFPLQSTNIYSWDLWQADTYSVVIKESFFLFKKLYILSPYLYFSLYILISGLASGVIAIISYQLSYLIKNKIFVLSFMFVFINLTAIYLNSNKINLDIMSYVFGYNAGSQSYGGLILVFLIYGFIAIFSSVFSSRKLKDCL